MNSEILDFVKVLSLNDKKSLIAKATKITEENGELARLVLPYESAAGTHHRFVEKSELLEECVDVILAALSIPYELGFTNADIESMMWRKATKWQGIQAKEEPITSSNIPFELHVTVTNPGDVEKFKSDCTSIGVKAIVIDLEHDFETVMTDVMTSSVVYGTNSTAYAKINVLSDQLTDLGYDVIRKKIETVPWHPKAPTNKFNNTTMPEGCYFESHIGVLISSKEKEELSKIAKSHNAHLSKNFFKKTDSGKYVNMITLRNYSDTFEMFDIQLNELKVDLISNGFTFDKEVVEFSLWDSKVHHDATWLGTK